MSSSSSISPFQTKAPSSVTRIPLFLLPALISLVVASPAQAQAADESMPDEGAPRTSKTDDTVDGDEAETTPAEADDDEVDAAESEPAEADDDEVDGAKTEPAVDSDDEADGSKSEPTTDAPDGEAGGSKSESADAVDGEASGGESESTAETGDEPRRRSEETRQRRAAEQSADPGRTESLPSQETSSPANESAQVKSGATKPSVREETSEQAPDDDAGETGAHPAASTPQEPVVEIQAGPAAPARDRKTAQDQDGSSTENEQDVVIVTGTRSSEMAGAVQVIGKKKLERLEYDDPHSVLRQVPGVFVREEDGVGLRPNISMRGANPDRSKKVTLMEDGVLFGPAPYSAPAAYYFPMMTRITQVRVIKGPGAVAFGPQTVGGAVDLMTRSIPVGPRAGLDLGYGQYGYRKAHAFAGTSNEQFGFLLEGVHVGNDGFKHLPDGTNTGAARNEWMVKGSYLVDPTAQVSNQFFVKLGYSEEASNETYLGLTDADFDDDPNQRYPASKLDRMDNHRTSLSLTHELKSYKDDYELRTTIYRNDFFRIWRKFNRLGGASAASVLTNPGDPTNAAYYAVLSGQADSSSALDTLWIGPNQREFVSQGISSRFRWELQSGDLSHKIEAGLRLHHDSIERDHSEEAFLMSEGDLISANEPSMTTTSNFASSHALSVHLTDAISYRRLTLIPGIRLEGIYSQLHDYLAATTDERALVALMPGLGAYYALTKDWGLLAGAYRGFSPPAPGSSDSVQPETSVNYELGTRYSASDTKAELIGFFNDYSNLTDICTFSSGCLDENLDRQFDAGQAHIYGLEALASHELSVGAVTLPLSAAYTLNFGEFRSSFQSADPIYGAVEAGDELPYVPRHQLNAQVAFEYDRFEAYIVGNYVSAVREEAGTEPFEDSLSTDPLVTLGAGASAEVLPFLEFYLNARNLFDYQGIMAHRPFGARPNAPLWIQGGAKVEL